jgi:Rps23 Pro-64 3,4-dihydroxylase Tpa1-like proline 4-hydroxylase
MIRELNWYEIKESFQSSIPFNHVVIDNFFIPEVADKISEEFPDFYDSSLNDHHSPLEIKKTMNRWDRFPPTTYRAFSFLNSRNFVERLSHLVDRDDLVSDPGLNGGGWHMHTRGGNNNIHLDYNVHPKLNLQRKLNIIVYLTKDWQSAWKGGLELWSHDEVQKEPLQKVHTIENKFNRAIVFDTTQNSWHGLPNSIECPLGVVRKSIAAYYLCAAPAITEERGRALFAPREEQKNDESIKELIKKRASVSQSASVYNTKHSEK